MKVLLSVALVAVGFGAFAVAIPHNHEEGSGDMMPAPPPMHHTLMKHAKFLKLLSCLCEGDLGNCAMADTFFNCVKDDMVYLGNATDMSPCDIRMKLEMRPDACFGENGSMTESITMCKEKLHAEKMAKMDMMGMDKSEGKERHHMRMDPCMPKDMPQEET